MQAFMKSGASTRSRYDEDPLFNIEEPAIEPSAVVDPSASAVDPSNEKFIPSNKQELKLSVLNFLSDLEDVQVERVYILIKDAIEKMRDEERKMAEKSKSVQEVIRSKVRKILQEAELPPVRKIPFGVSGTGWLDNMKRSLKSAFKSMQLDDNEQVISDIASRVKPNDPVGSIKRAARYLKDNVPGDVEKNLKLVIDAVAQNDPATGKQLSDTFRAQPNLVPKTSLSTADVGGMPREEIAKALKEKHGTNIRDIEDKAMQKFKKVSSVADGGLELKDEVSMIIMLAMQDFVDLLSSDLNWLYNPEDIEIFKSNPAIAAEMGTFRIFLDPYIDVLVEEPEDPALRKYAAELGAKMLKREIKKIAQGKPGELDIPGLE